ncbi:methyltransferase domain-containing protein [Streptomyces sp. VTCC 41912]|uniref:methyltransferase domain-containing protein n=1 Tax=Streptomyces sp. VTCC 41912 TaxID=3383243 RepID=UPI003896B397
MTTTTPSAGELRRLMTERLVSTGALHSEEWEEAFLAVPRHTFVPRFAVRSQGTKIEYSEGDPSWLTAAYSDVSLLTQSDAAGTTTSSSTEPSLMARMLEALDVEDGDDVLEIGSGTGYNAGLLAYRLGDEHVVSMDVDPDLVNVARGRLQEAGFAPTLVTGNGMKICPERAQYDRLLATCGVGRIPTAWPAQVRPGGIIVANIASGIARLTVDAEHAASGHFLPHLATFMLARATATDVSRTAGHFTRDLLSWTGATREIVLPASLDAEVPQLLSSLIAPDVLDVGLSTGAGQIHCLFEPSTSSWARITLLDPRTAQLDHGGPRDLWAERAPLHSHWANHGRPSPDRYGLTISSDGAHTLWLDSPSGTSWRLP